MNTKAIEELRIASDALAKAGYYVGASALNEEILRATTPKSGWRQSQTSQNPLSQNPTAPTQPSEQNWNKFNTDPGTVANPTPAPYDLRDNLPNYARHDNVGEYVNDKYASGVFKQYIDEHFSPATVGKVLEDAFHFTRQHMTNLAENATNATRKPGETSSIYATRANACATKIYYEKTELLGKLFE